MLRTMKLSLAHAMYYTKTDENIEDLISRLYKEGPGFETLIQYEFAFRDEGLDLERKESGFHMGPPSLEPMKDENPGFSLELKVGEYLFSQLPVPEDENTIKMYLMPFLRDFRKGTVFVRFYKENVLECVMQFFLPVETN